MIVGVNFKKLIADKRKNKFGSININNNIRIVDVKESKMITAKGDKALDVDFEFVSKYEPDVAQILIEGVAVYVNKDKETTKIFKQWEKEKKLPEKALEEVLSALLLQANIEAVLLSKEINIPPPIPMPRVSKAKTQKASKEDKSYIG